MKTFRELQELLAEARQFKDPKKDSMVTKAGKTIVIDKDKEAEYLKKGWTLSEDGINEAMNLNQLKKKYKNDLKQYENDWYFKNDKAELAFMKWAMANGEVRTSDPDEFDKFMSDLLDGEFDDV